ncbi:MAG TPA: galactose oxidase-like domain-containing protein [Gemmatimonadaceae bacterium]|nr:galactose oxidase-like domain-containing protein [Gemmatimonadaceae bacterium]
MAVSSANAFRKTAPRLLRVAALAVVSLAAASLSASQDLTQIKVQYRCGNYFRVTNGNSVAVQATWDVYQTGENGSVSLPAKWGTYSNSETYLQTTTRGSLRLSIGGKQVASKGNGGQPCPVTPTVGSWGSLFTWWPHTCSDPLAVDACEDSSIAIHALLLPTGKVMTWGRRRMGEQPVFWDPTAGTGAGSFTAGPVEISDEFCSGYDWFPDGRLLVVGGHPLPQNGGDFDGTTNANVYNWQTNTWTAITSMQYGRWYPTAITLPNGNILVVSGDAPVIDEVPIPEEYAPDGTRQTLTSANLLLYIYPRIFVAPTSTPYVFYAGEMPQSQWLNLNTNTWSAGGMSTSGVNRDYGSAAIYDGKVLFAGGGGTDTSPPLAVAEVMDLNNGPPGTWKAVGSLNYARRQTNLTILANGKMLMTGGSGGVGNDGNPGDPVRLIAEQFDPVTQIWTSMAAQSRARFYHTTALLLLDGRLLQMGSGEPSPGGQYTDDLTRNAEIYTPTYLYNPDGTLTQRPAITAIGGASGTPPSTTWGSVITVSTPNAAGIQRVLLIRLGAVTHAFNHGQRLNTLTFSQSAGTLSVTMPPDNHHAPPGYYMLVIIDTRGVPSTGQVIQLH